MPTTSRSHLVHYRTTGAPQADRFVLGAVPLNRPSVVRMLTDRRSHPRGVRVAVLAQRPAPAAERAWLADLRRALEDGQGPTVEDLLAVDDAHLHLRAVATDRLVPARSLDKEGFLTRNLGGWAPIYLDVFGLPAELPDDPVLAHLDVLADYGADIQAIGADADLVRQRLDIEVGGIPSTAARMLLAAGALRWAGTNDAAVEALAGMVRADSADGAQPAVAPAVVYDALLSLLTEVEDQRRARAAEGDAEGAERIATMQARWRDELGLVFILKGEYIAGRHRRSTVLIAPAFGAVVKQPAPEPLHDIALGHRTDDGRPENWPRAVAGGPLVTSRGRLRMMLEEGAFPRLARAFRYPVTFCTMLGLHIEPFVAGDTLQRAALADPGVLTPELYTEVLVHQQVCEVMGVDNADWHAANFMMRDRASGGRRIGVTPSLVHVDWAAARPLSRAELAGRADAARARVDQVRNLAYSFHDERLAARVNHLHDDLTGDDEVLADLRRQAQRIVADSGEAAR